MRDGSSGVIAIVLASGIGARLGGPKALLRVGGAADGMPLVEAQCRDRLASECARALAVVREDVARMVGDRLRAAGAEVVISRAPDSDGPAGSLAAAAAHLGDTSIRAAVVTPVDVRVQASTVRALVEALLAHAVIEAPAPGPRREALLAHALIEAPARAFGVPFTHALIEAPPPGSPPPLAIVPRFQGRRGHPVVLGPEALARYREAAPPPLRDHLRSLGDRAVALDVDDPWILEDLDFAHQTATLLRFTGAPAPAFVR